MHVTAVAHNGAANGPAAAMAQKQTICLNIIKKSFLCMQAAFHVVAQWNHFLFENNPQWYTKSHK